MNAQTNVPIPSPAEILKTLRPGHPRLFASKADFAALKQRIAGDARLKDWHAHVLAEGTRILAQEPSKYEIPDGKRLLSTSRRVLGRIQTLGLLHQLDGDRRWAARAWKELDAAAAFKDWNPSHFLDTAEMTHAFAVGYDWFFDTWTPAQRETLRAAMVGKGFKPALEVYTKNNWWARARHNWNQVCNGGIGVGALALGDVEPGLAGQLLHHGLQSIQLAMAEFAPDGAWAEGPGYWSYATTYNCAILAALDTALGTDFGLAQIPGFGECGTFPIHATGPTGKSFNYADSGDSTPRAPHLFWLAKKFHRPEYAAYQTRVASPHPLDLIWYDSALVKEHTAPLDKYFRAAEVATLRSAWDDTDALFVGFKAGDNKANHSNLDLGTFVLDALGARWAHDLGADDYNLPGYFGKARWTYYRMRAESHNTVIINPGTDPDQDPRAAAKIIRYESKPERAFAIADLTPAHQGRATGARRGIAMLQRREVLVQDEVACPNSSEVWWLLHTPAKLAINRSGNTATFTQNGKKLTARLLAPRDAKFEQRATEPLPTSPNPPKQRSNRGAETLAVHLTGVREAQIVVLFTPGENAGKAEVVPLKNW